MKNSSQSTISYTIENTLTTASFSVQCTPDKCPILRQLIEEKEKEISRLREENQQLVKSLEQLTGTKNLYSHMIFGRSSEKTSETQAVAPSEKTPLEDSPVPSNDNDDKTVPAADDNPHKPDIPHNNVHHISRHPKRKRGAQPGHKGHGRKIPENLPVIRVLIKVPEDKRFCQICRDEHDKLPFTENSNVIEVRQELYRVEYVRERLKRACDCDSAEAGNRFITAPQPPHAIEKSKFGHNLLSLLVVQKYLFAIPLQRMLTILGMQGTMLASGSITGAFKKLLLLLKPLYESLAVVSKQEGQWNIDETGWNSFIRQINKNSFLSWMWVFVSKKVIFYVLDPSRASKVPLDHLGEKAQGIVIADRFSAYSKLAKMALGLTVAICWAHFRRDFINAGKSFEQLKPWANLWKDRIAEIYRLNHRRLNTVWREQEFAEAQLELEQAIEKMKKDIAAELKDPPLHWEQRKVLNCAQKYWGGLTVFVRRHEVPMDNNKAERALRRIALGRNNYYGTYAEWSGLFAAVCLSVLQTAVLHGLNPVAYLRYYLDSCARAGGVPEHLERFHPWNIPEDVREEYDMQQKGSKS